MIERRKIKDALLGAREFVEGKRFLRRDAVPRGFNYLFTGARGSGKTSLLCQGIQDLIAEGHGWDEILYLDFEDERLLGMELSDLSLALEVFGETSGKKPFIFLDEIGVVGGWEHFARRIADSGYRVCVAGSSARMQEGEAVMTLGGRYVCRTVYPFSYGEFLRAKGSEPRPFGRLSELERGRAVRLARDFVREGGFPEVVSSAHKRERLHAVCNRALLGDAVVRHGLANAFALKLMLSKFAKSLGEPLSFNRLTHAISESGGKVAKGTVISYAEALRDACLVFPVPDFAEAVSGRPVNRKYYFADQGIPGLFGTAESARFENAVALELARIADDPALLFYLKGKEGRVDFFVPDRWLAVQAAETLEGDSALRKKKLDAFAELARKKGFGARRFQVVTLADPPENVEVEGTRIEILPFNDWVLSLQA